MKVRMRQRSNSLRAKVSFGLLNLIIIIPEKVQKAIFSHPPHQFYHLETAGKYIFYFAVEKGKLKHQNETQMSSLPQSR